MRLGSSIPANNPLALCLALLVILLSVTGTSAALAQQAPSGQTEADNSGAEAPRVVIKFLTSDNYPPFNSRDEDGILTGLNIDLARAICLSLAMTCDIQARGWRTLPGALQRGEADAVIAAHRVTAQTLKNFDFTDRYFHTPARFAVRRESTVKATTPDGLGGLRAGVVRGSAHEAFLATYFRNTRIQAFDSPETMQLALLGGKVDAIFGDGIGLAFWANGSLSKACCRLLEGAFFEPAYFGDGVGIMVKKNNRSLLLQLNSALERVRKSGRFNELVERYFPIRVY